MKDKICMILLNLWISTVTIKQFIHFKVEGVVYNVYNKRKRKTIHNRGKEPIP